MKIAAFALFFAAAFAAAPLYAQSASAAAAAQETNAKTGVRFVIVAPEGGTLPSPLFCKMGKVYKEIKIGSRVPTARVRPEGGVINFYKENPVPDAGFKGDGAAKPTAADKAKLPEPLFSVEVPGNASKMLCIVVPNKEGKKPQTFFLDEKDFPTGGMHIINFSPNKLQMVTSAKQDFSDAEKKVIGVFKRDAGVSPDNSWSYKGEVGKPVSFKLSFLPKDGKGEKDLRLIAASAFTTSDRQSQINVVVKVAGNNERLKVMPLQLMDDNAPNK